MSRLEEGCCAAYRKILPLVTCVLYLMNNSITKLHLDVLLALVATYAFSNGYLWPYATCTFIFIKLYLDVIRIMTLVCKSKLYECIYSRLRVYTKRCAQSHSVKRSS